MTTAVLDKWKRKMKALEILKKNLYILGDSGKTKVNIEKIYTRECLMDRKEKIIKISEDYVEEICVNKISKYKVGKVLWVREPARVTKAFKHFQQKEIVNDTNL